MKLIEYFDQGCQAYPRRACLVDAAGTLTYEEVARLTHKVANGLLAAGLTSESKYAALSPNCNEAYVACLGGLRMGAKWTSLAAGNALEESIERMQRNDCECLFLHSSFADVAKYISQKVPSLRLLVCLDGPAGPYPVLEEWADLYPDRAPPFDFEEDDVVFHAGSGGTSGVPKSVLLTNRNMSTVFAAMSSLLPHQTPPVHLLVVPLTYAQGLVSLWLMALGATNVLLSKADPIAILEAIERYRVSTVTLPPTVIYRLIDHPHLQKFDLSSLRYIHYAMAPISTEKLQKALAAFGPVMLQTYGQAESPTVMTCLTPADHVRALHDPRLRKRLRSCGRPSSVCEIEIMDELGNLLPNGEVGEIVCRGPLVMKGYYKEPEATAATRAFGWHHTGDLGHRDEDGYIYIDGRKKDMIITGGFNVYPAEVEKTLGSHPSVKECVVLGRPDEDWGETVVGVVELVQGAKADTADILTFCRDRLGPVKTPKSIVVRTDLPRNEIGKVLRHEVRRQLLAE